MAHNGSSIIATQHAIMWYLVAVWSSFSCHEMIFVSNYTNLKFQILKPMTSISSNYIPK